MVNTMRIVDIGTVFGVRPSTDLDLGTEALLQMMAQNQVDEAMVCSLKAIQHNFTAGNDETVALCLAHPNLYPVAVVDPRQAPDCMAEVERCVAQGCMAFRFFCDYQGWSIASRSFGHLLQAVAHANKPAIVHAPASGDATALLDIVAGSDIPVVLAAITYPVLSEALAVMADAPNLYIEAHRVALPGQVELMVEQVGPERIMFGSWAPLFSQRPSMDMVLGSEVSSEAKALILGGNARRLFKLTDRMSQ